MVHAELRICVLDPARVQAFKNRADSHNQKVANDPHPDSGFDLPTPLPNDECLVHPTTTSHKFPLGVKCALYAAENPRPFYIYPRSSTGSKTTLRLSNSVGIIDSGYRGELIAVFDNIQPIGGDPIRVANEQRLVQLCAGDLSPFFVRIVSEDGLGDTSRGSGGFGSSGV